MARHFINPEVLIVAPETVDPIVLSTGILSPVRADSLMALFPSITMPSTGTFSPGLTTKISPTLIFSIGISFSFPYSSIITAVLGASFIRLFMASVVLPLLMASSILPTVISVRIIAADSK